MSENKYRNHLSDDKFHRQYLRNEDEPGGSSFLTKLGLAAVATVGVAMGARKAYDSGMMRGAIAAMITKTASYRRSEGEHLLAGLREWSENKNWKDINESGGSMMSRQMAKLKEVGRVGDYLKQAKTGYQARTARLGESPFIQDEMPHLLKFMRDRSKFLDDLKGQGVNSQTRQRALNTINTDFIASVNNLTRDQVTASIRRTDHRFATVDDMLRADSGISDTWRTELQSIRNEFGDAGGAKFVDSNIFINSKNQFADMRDFRRMVQDVANSAAEDFAIPFIKINPMRMFYLNELTRMHDKPNIALFKSHDRQPLITGGNERLGQNMMFMNGKVFDLEAFDSSANRFKVVEENGYLIGTQDRNSPLVRSTRNLFDMQTSHFAAPAKGPRKLLWHIANVLDVGLQNDRIGGADNITGDPMAPISMLARKFWSVARPYGSVKRIEMNKAFGEDSDYLFMRGYKNPKQAGSASGYFSQFWTSRTQHQNVTTASFLSYTFFERLNATLNQVGLGLSSKNLGSPHQIMYNLVAKRVAPVWLGVEAIKHTNYVFDQMFGEEYEDKFAKFYAHTQSNVAGVRDALGITNFAKNMTQLMPGIEFLSELPVPVITTEGITPIMLRDIMPLNQTKEELRRYYESGEEPVRKGRYWETGNTPLVGGKVDYFQPNWYRRITSDYQYTDTMWGSKEEYWANNALPTLTNPFSPIKHFITDPYHWEKKHYEDRPYMQTGGIAEIEEVPLIGGLLNATIGQLLKPTRNMHEGETAETFKRTSGYSLAEQYGLVGGGPGAAGAAAAFVAGGGGADYAGSGGYTGALNPSEPLAYVTSGGNISLMKKTGDMHVRDINMRIKQSGIGKTGQAQAIRGEETDLATAGAMVSAADATGFHAALTDIRYNATELGGFYGWVSTMPFSKDGQYEPRIQTSSTAYGYTRAFWDSDYGNMGADANEIFRRFLPRDMHKNYVNTVDNNMPTWMPGADYFTNFQQGDPYVKVKKGEMRLPGESYEVLYGIDSEKLDKMHIGASHIGYDKQTIAETLLHKNDVKDEFFQRKLDFGTAWHKKWEREMAESGVAISMESYVKDEEAGIGGFYDLYGDHKNVLEYLLKNATDFKYYQRVENGATAASMIGNGLNVSDKYGGFYADAVSPLTWSQDKQQSFFNRLLSQSQYALIDPKTRSTKEFDTGEMHFENTQQVNFYASQMKTNINYLIHVDRENPERGFKVFAFDTSPELLNYTYNKVNGVRGDIRQMMADGVIGRGDLYDPIDRFRILADVAPFSNQYKQMVSQISLMNLSEAEMDEVQGIKKQVAQRKEHRRTYDYKFKTADVDKMDVTVTRIIDNNMFMTEEFPDNPIRFAGVYIPKGKDDPLAQEAKDIIEREIRPGKKITISVTADKDNRVNADTYRTISAVVSGRHIENLNRSLLERGLAKERENQNDAAAIHARFSPLEIAFGKTWESFAHFDTPFHTKLLQVRSPLEQYERREVYGKDWQDWATPISDYAVPWFQNQIAKDPFAAAGLGALMGWFFGSGGKYGNIIGAMVGGTLAAVGSSIVTGKEIVTGEKWIPQRRQDERAIEEYIDVLKYVKYNALYQDAAEMSRSKGFNVEAYIAKQKRDGEFNKTRVRMLQQLKREMVTGTKKEQRAANEKAADMLGIKASGDVTKAINGEITRIQNDRHVDKLSPEAAKAIQYHQMSEQTMYGYDAGEPIANILAALPKKERQYVGKFLDAPEEERQEILDTVPSYVRRVLQSTWGMDVDAKPTLEEYFKNHELPDERWLGWDSRANLDDVRIKLVKHEGLDNSEFDIWPDDVKRAAQISDEITPELNVGDKASVVRERLKDILGKAGLEDLEIEVMATSNPGVKVSADILKDRRAEIVQQLNENGYSLFG